MRPFMSTNAFPAYTFLKGGMGAAHQRLTKPGTSNAVAVRPLRAPHTQVPGKRGPLILGFLLTLLLFSPANAQNMHRIVSDKPAQTALTIYPDDLALITEMRTIDLPVGKSKIVFEGVNDRMIPASILLRQFEGVSLERNFNPELLGKANLFARSVGQTVQLTRTDSHSGRVTRESATIISADEGQGVVFRTNGGLEAYQCSGLGEMTRFEALPAGLNNVPELSIDVRTQTAGKRTMIISYLAEGFDWAADYRLDAPPTVSGRAQGRFSGWLTFSNHTAQNFKNAPVSVVAGHLNRSWQTRAPEKHIRYLAAHCWPRQSTKTPIFDAKSHLYRATAGFRPEMDEIVVTGQRKMDAFASEARAYAPAPPKEENLSEYKLYRMSAPLTLASYQTKQIRFIDKPEVAFDPVFTFVMQWNALKKASLQPAILEYRLDNAKEGKLAKALPAGTYRVMSHSRDGQIRYLGEDKLDNLAVDLPVKIKANTSFNVQMKTSISDVKIKSNPALVPLKKLKKILNGRKKNRFNIVHVFSNAYDVPVRIEFKPERQWQWQYYDIKNPSLKPDEGAELKWTFTIPAQSSRTLTYTAIKN